MFCCTNSVLKLISKLSVNYRPVAEMAWNNPWPYISLSDKRLNCSKNDLWEPQIEFTKSRANVPKACQLLIFTSQRVNKRANAIRRANVLIWRANVPKGVPIFQTFLLRNAKWNFYTLLLYRKFYILLDIIVIHILLFS